jgi:hypothetical protein
VSPSPFVMLSFSNDVVYRSKLHLLTLYFLDSGSYSSGIFNLWASDPQNMTGFGRVRLTGSYKNLVCLALVFSCSLDMHDSCTIPTAFIDSIERPFTPDSGKDFGGLWAGERQAGNQIPPVTKRLAKPNALMFFHIPLCVLDLSFNYTVS